MTKKMAVITVEFDDPEDNFETTSDFALFAEVSMMKSLPDIDVTVYATPEDLSLDTAQGISIFRADRDDRPALLARPQDIEPEAPKA